MFTQEQGSDSLPIENDPVGIVIQTIESPVQQITDGKKIIYLFYLLQPIWIEKSSLIFVDTNAESSEPIQPDTIGASSAFPSPLIETTTEKVLYSLHRLSSYKLIQSS